METILIFVHLVIVIALVIVVLLQRSEGGALGIGGGGGGMMTARGAASALTRLTAILAAAFFITSLSLGLLARYGSQPTDILDRLPVNQGGTAVPGAAGSGSLLDQLGGLPEDDGGTVETDQPLTVPNAATPPASGQAAPAESSPVTITPNETPATGAPIGTAPSDGAASPTSEPVDPVPATPGEGAPNAADVPTVPPVEAPPAGADRPATGGTTGSAQ